MKIIPKLQEGNVIRQDNTRVATKPIIKPTEYYIRDLGGQPSTDTRTSSERNRDYWHPIKGAKERFKSSMSNKTNPLVGLENTVMPAMAGAALVTTPATLIGGTIGSEAVNNATGGFGKWLEGKTGIPSEIGEYLNPGAIYGGAKGYNITKNKLASKFIKGEEPINDAITSGVIRTKAGNKAHSSGKVNTSKIKLKPKTVTYTGSATPEGNNGDRDLLGMYLFQNDPLISKSPWFQKVAQSFKPAKGKGFSYSDRYSKLYPGIEQRRYQMQSVVKDSRPLRFRDIEEFNEYSSGIGKLQGKEGDMVIEMPDGFQTFRQPGTNYVGPIDDVGGHVIKIDYNNKGKLTQISQDMWKFNPADYAKRWSGKSVAEGVRATKQAALMDKVGTPFILQQENPIYIGSRRVWDSIKSIPKNPYIRRQPLMQGALLTMKKGGLIPRCQAGATIKDAAIGMIPIVGTYQDYKKFRDNPTWGNFGWLAASALGDALFFTGAGAALKGIKAARAAAKGDVKSMFQNLRNYKVAEQKQLAAARQQVISGAKRKGGSLVSDGRRFKFKDSPLVRNSKTLNNKRDMRKKFMKSDRPTYTNNRIRRGQEGLRFVNYDEVKNPELNFNDYKLSVDTFSPYNIPVKSNETEPIRERIVEKIVEVPVEVTKQEEKEEVKVPWTNQYKNNKQQWITDLTNAYRNAGITNEDTLNMLISQDALESGWGRSAQGDYNFGNITAGKYWKGRTVTGGDHNAKGQKISQVFRAYDSINDYAKDKVDFLKRLYDFTEGDTIDVFANKLQGGNRGKRKYAEAPNYVEMLKKVYRGGK